MQLIKGGGAGSGIKVGKTPSFSDSVHKKVEETQEFEFEEDDFNTWR